MEELREILKGAHQIYIKANESFLFAKYFDTAKNDKEQMVIKNKSIRFIQYTTYRNSIIEVAKLFSPYDKKNNYFSIYTIQQYIINYYKENSIPSKIDNTVLKQWKEFLKCINSQINNIMLLRHNFYAHTAKDKESFYTKIELSYEDMENVLGTAFIIISDMHLKIFNEGLLYKNIYFDKVNFIEILAEHKITREERVNKMLGRD